MAVHRLETTADLDALFVPARAYDAGRGAWEAESDGGSIDTGPGTNTTVPYVISDGSGIPTTTLDPFGTITENSVLTLRPTVAAQWTGPGRILATRACIQGPVFLSAAEGLELQGRVSSSDAWTSIVIWAGWAPSNSYTTGGTIVDSAGVTQTFAQDGAWVDFEQVVPDNYTQFRLRVKVISAAPSELYYQHDVAMWNIELRRGNIAPTVAIDTVAQDVESSTVVSLVATAEDRDGYIATYAWTATGGVFTNPTIKDAIWTAPVVQSSRVYALVLTVTDNDGVRATATVDITVNVEVIDPNEIFAFGIHGVDYLDALVYQSVQIDESLHINGAQMTCMVNLQLLTSPGALAAPKAGQFVVFSVNRIREFAGRITRVTQVRTGIDTLQYVLHCVDFTTDFDAVLLQPQVFPEQNGSQTIREIIGTVGKDFDAQDVENTPIHAELAVDLDRGSRVIGGIVESTDRQWYIDYYKNIHVFQTNADTHPRLAALNLDSDIDTYDDLTYDEDWSQVKNRLYLADVELRGGPDTIEVTPGEDITFLPLNWPPWSGTTTVVNINGVSQDILIDTVDGEVGDGAGELGQVYLCIGNWGIRTPDNHPIPAGATVTVHYSFVQEDTIIVEDPDSIRALALLENHPSAYSDGIHEMKMSIPNLRLADRRAIREFALAILKRYSSVEKIVTFRSTVQGWRAGQYIRIFSAERDLDEYFYIRGVQKAIWVPYSSTDRQGPSLQYQIEASTSPYHT